MPDPAETQEVDVDAFRQTTTELHKAAQAMEDLAAVLAKDAEANGQRTWFDKHPGTVVTIVGMLCSGLIVGAQYYFRNELEKGQREFYKETTQPKVEAVEKSVKEVRTDAKREHKALNEKVKNVGILQIEQGKDHRKILKDLAEKQRVTVPEKTPDLKAAESKVMEP